MQMIWNRLKNYSSGTVKLWDMEVFLDYELVLFLSKARICIVEHTIGYFLRKKKNGQSPMLKKIHNILLVPKVFTLPLKSSKELV